MKNKKVAIYKKFSILFSSHLYFELQISNDLAFLNLEYKPITTLYLRNKIRTENIVNDLRNQQQLDFCLRNCQTIKLKYESIRKFLFVKKSLFYSQHI